MNRGLRVTPFRVGGPIRDPADFAGREQVLQQIAHAMLNLQNVSLHGERRTGKTSVLLYLAHPASDTRLPETHIPVYFSFQDLAEASIVGVWQALADAVAAQIEQRHPDRQADSQRFLATTAEFLTSSKAPALFGTGFGRALAQLEESGFKVHLLFDEFDQTARNPSLGDAFYDALRSLPIRAENVSYVIASRTGLAALQPIYSKVSSPFFNIFTTLVLAPFRKDEVHRLIFDYFARAGLDLSLAEKLCAESAFLYDVTGYHPFFLQTLCYHLCAGLDKPEWPRGEAQQEALGAFEMDSESHFDYYWEVSSVEEQELIEKLAVGQSVGWDAAGNTTKSLEDRCLIVPGESAWRLFSSVFARWVQEQQPEETQAHLGALTRLPKYARWADRPYVSKQDEDYYIKTESKIVPLFASPYEDDTGQQRENLLEIIHTHKQLLILGEPGVGKTAALERIVWETANAKGSVVPIYVPLSHYSGDLMAEVHSALTETGVLHFSSAQDLETFLRQNPCLVLFDGLNEVRRGQRRQILRDVANFLHRYRRHHYVVTSRSQDPLWKTLRDDGVIREAVIIQPVTKDQVREYLIAHLGDQKGGQTHDSLNECLRGMSRTPLFLWMLKEVRLEGGELPGNRGELFYQFVERLFDRDERRLELSISRSAKKQALACLAFALQQEHRVACQEEEAITTVSTEYDPQALVGEAQIHGLLIGMERGGEQQVRFMHQAVQEYFVALALREIVAQEVDNPAWQQLGKRVLRRGLAAWAGDPRWAESFVQLAGLTSHPSWLAREIARVNPWLAFWCMIEGQEVDEEVQRVIEAKTVGLLHSGDVRERWNAVQALGRLENPRTARYLVDVLGDEAEEIANAAVQGLGKLGEPAVEPLLPCLHLDDIRVRQAATRALGIVWRLPQLGNLGNADASLRLAALEDLGQRGESRAVEAIVAVACWDMDLAVRQHAVEVLGQLGDTRAVGPLLTLLADEPSLRASAVTALGQIGDERAVEPLTKALRDDDQVVRRGAITALGRIWELQQFVRLGDEREAVREHAAAALGRLGNMRAVQPLVATLRDSAVTVCASAATALGQLGNVQAVTPLISVLLTRDEPTARSSAAEALGKLDDRRAVEPLIAALEDRERDVRRSVATALGQLRDERAIEPLIAVCKDRHVQENAVKALAQIGRPAVPPLISALRRDGERDVRAAAAITLGQIGGIQALEALLIFLTDDDGIVRASVALALGQVGDPQIVPVLAVTLREDRSRIVRASAAISLGRLGGTQAIEALTSTLKDDDEDEAVWRMAIRALGQIWNLPHIVWLSDKDATRRQDAAVALGQMADERAIEPLLATLKDRDEPVRRRATSALGQIWDLPQMAQLGDAEARMRQNAALALGQLGDVRAVEPLIAALRRDSSAAVRLAAARALGHLDDERAVQPLIEALDDDDRDVQRGASEALQRLERLATRDLIAALRDSNYWFRRRKAAETLAPIGDLASLIEALKHKDRFVRQSATEELVQRGDTQAVEPLIGVLRDDDDFVRRKAAEALGKIGDARAVGPLIEALKDDSWHVRLVVTEALGNIEDRSTVESLVAALQDDAWPVRWMAAKALGKLRDSRAVGPLIEALQGKWPALWTVAEALGQLKDVSAVESLVAALRDSDSDQYVQQAAVEALGRIGEPIQKHLIDVLRDGPEGARQRAIAALGQMRDARDLAPLIEALRFGPSYEVWQGAMEALVQLGEPAVEPLIAVLQGDEWMARRRAARALGRIGNTRAVPPLVEALGDPIRSVRQAAAEALYRIDTPEARSAIRRYEATHPGEWSPAEE